jgi:hypothetical protein
MTLDQDIGKPGPMTRCPVISKYRVQYFWRSTSETERFCPTQYQSSLCPPFDDVCMTNTGEGICVRPCFPELISVVVCLCGFLTDVFLLQ